MVFSSMTFMCVFLPIVLLLYYIIPTLPMKNFLLIIASLLFYAYGEPVYVLLMIFSILANYFMGRGMGIDDRWLKKSLLVLAVCVNLGLLAVFKYADMMITTMNQLFGTHIPQAHLALPIGISFFTFQALSYVIDAYRQKVGVQKNLWNMMLYISFFPQLIAGPIVKYQDIELQITDRHIEAEEIARGMRRFIIGLSKKVLISNTVAIAADGLFGTPLGQINILSAWIAAIAYMLQIYYDFSGYSDMAIGLGHMFGFHFLENFRYPYVSGSVQEFWRRWHISLSTWFKEYLYFPLGGNRKGRGRTCFNKIVVFFSTGLWHGANWTFVLWGLWHGAFLLVEEVIPMKRLPGFLRHLYTLLVVCVGFVMFRAQTFTQGIQMIGKMFAGWDMSGQAMNVAVSQLNPLFLITLLVGVVGSAPILDRLKTLPFSQGKRGRRTSVASAASYAGSFVLLLICMLSLSAGTYNPFIYFRF